MFQIVLYALKTGQPATCGLIASKAWRPVWMRQCVSSMAIWLMVAVATAEGSAPRVP
jgi:hypothetical protein